MDFELSVEQSQLVKNARSFLKKEIAPLVVGYERSGEVIPKEEMRELLKRLIPFGYVSGVLPEEAGGSGLSFTDYGLILEELAKVYPSLALCEIGQSLVTRYPMYKLGSAYLKEKYLPGMTTGDILGAAALTEPDTGSAARDIITTAVLEGAEYVINGTKTWSTGGDIADVIYVTAVRNPAPGQPKDYCTFVVDRSISRYTTTVYHKLGTRGVGSAEIVFEDCRVPQEHILGEAGKGLDATLEFIGLGRLANATIALGIAEAALERSVEYANQRKQFGRLIGRFQLIQEMIAEMATEIECSRLLCYKGWDALEKGKGSNRLFSMAKYYCTEMAVRVTSKAIEVHGAYGLSDEYPLERYFRDARCLTFPDATSEIQKLIIGRDIIGLQAFV
ncbi:MAG: acyl-CoA dehydrogenase family protein [Dehalococcoidales bacterium]|nr:acyl-CoA dehydrogenase family protein [Dehalococcoidales bacterium]